MVPEISLASPSIPKVSSANSRDSVMKRVKAGQAFRSDHLVDL